VALSAAGAKGPEQFSMDFAVIEGPPAEIVLYLYIEAARA
jgi:hypothetical protein